VRSPPQRYSRGRISPTPIGEIRLPR